MPMSSKKRIVEALGGDAVRLDVGNNAGFACPVCREWLSAEGEEPVECPHLLRWDWEGTEWNRKCWVRSDAPTDAEGDGGEEEGANWSFDRRKARKAKDRFLLTEEWVPVHTNQCDTGGNSWHGWFAVPAKLLGGSSPVLKMEKLISKAEQALRQGDDGEGEQ